MVSGDLVGYKLSPQQRHLWRLQQDDPAQPYRAYCAVSIEGVIDRTALMRAMQALTDRHEILRVCFASLPGIAFPLQVVREFVAPSTTETDLCDLSLEQQNREIEAALDAAEQISFNLELGPLIRLSLLRLSAGKCLALFLSPALCLDWVSLQNLMRDLGSCYSACLRGDAPVPPLALYADVSEVFNDLLESPDREMGRDFWTRPELSDPAGLRLPFEISQQERPEFVPRRFRFTPDATVAAGIAKLEREFETPGATFFLACWQLLLWRLSGQSDFSVGVGYDGRTYDELEAMLGLFARYLPLHVHCQGGDSFDGFLRQVDQSRREISRWQDYFSWGEKQKGWNNTRSSPFPLFCFEYLKEMKELSESGVKFTADRQCACFDRFRMKLSCIEAGGGLVAEIHYDAGFYTAEHVRELAGQYQRLLEAGIRGPQRAVGLLEIISEDEQRRVLLEFNSTTAEFPRSKCLHTLFEDQVERTPDNIAVFCGSERFSYRHLNQRANSLGHQLRAAGVGPEVLVAILMEHSVEMIIGLLAILKAGGAYVPLDPSYPPERTLFMLEGTGVLLGRRRLSAVIPAYRGRGLYAETDWQFAEVMENPVGGVQPDNLAYVIFTSGSTGRPKGAMLPHRGMFNCLWWMQAHYRLTES